MTRYCLTISIFFLSLAVALPVLADEVLLKNGDRISGTIIKKDNGFLSIKTAYAGMVRVDWAFVTSVQADPPLVVLLNSKEVVKASSISDNGPEQSLSAARSVKKADVKLVNPPPYLSGAGVLWRGRLNIGASSSDGNTDTQNGHASGEISARTEKERYRLRGTYNWASDLGQETENNMEGVFKADHFLSERWFVSGRTAAYKDRFQDLNLRATVGASTGYQFFESHLRNLFVEAGLSYVYEDYRESEDKEYPAARWGLGYDVFVYQEKIQFFHEHALMVSLEDTEDMMLESETGLRFHITGNLNSTMQVDYDWNNSPGHDKERGDTKYIFTLGYSW